MLKQKFRRVIGAIRNPEKLLRYLRWLWQKTRPFLPSLSVLLALDILGIFIGFAGSFISKHVVDSATAGLDFGTAFLVMIIINVLSILLSAVVGVCSTLIHERYSFGVRLKVFDRVLQSDFLGLSKYHSGDLLTRLTSDVDTVANGIATSIPSLVMIVVRLTAAFFILLRYSPFLAFSALLLGPVGLLMSILLGEKLKSLSAEVKKNEAEYRSFMQETLANVTVVKTFCQEEASGLRLSALRARRLRTILRRNRLGVMMNLCIRILFSAGYLLAFGYCVKGLFDGTLTYGTMTLFLSLFSQIHQPIMGLSHLIPQLIGVLASAGRVMEMEDIPQDARTGCTQQAARVGLRFEDVTFAYQEQPVLRSVSFEAAPGQLVGVMGESGVGKTTLIRLALALTHANSGRVQFLYDGQAEAASADSRRHVAYVPQGNTLLSGSIADNLRFGNPAATEEDMWQALHMAAADFVHDLPKGLYTVIGEKATGLSEGQAQRIAIARALLRRAPVLILDEATSALDAATEEKILTMLSAPDRTYAPLCLIITHRASMKPYFDRLITISDGGSVSVQGKV